MAFQHYRPPMHHELIFTTCGIEYRTLDSNRFPRLLSLYIPWIRITLRRRNVCHVLQHDSCICICNNSYDASSVLCLLLVVFRYGSIPASILLKNGTILITSDEDQFIPLRGHSLLIEGKKIVQIGQNIDAPSPSTEIIDCTGKLISPGFIDTHHHLWQTQTKGKHADETLMQYMISGNWQCYNYTPEDVFWGQLGGCLEALDAGTTAIVDHSHMNKTPNSSPSAIAATVASGIRSVFAYSPTLRIATWKPSLTLDDSVLPEWVLNQVQELATLAPFGDGRVQFGLGFDGYFLPKEDVVNLFNRCRQAGTKLITSHYTRNIILGTDSIIELLDSYGLLGPDVIISHSTNLTAADVAKLNKTGASIACAPEVEIQMAFGNPVCFQKEIKHLCSLGIDSHSINSASLISQMRICLQAERGRRNTLLSNRNKVMKTLNTSVHDVFRLGTIQGARAMNMQDEIGSLADGKLADIVIFDAHSPAMICAVEEDPVAAIVLHSSVRDIDTVIIDGVIRKRAGRLLPVTVVGEFMDLSLDLGGTPRHMEWSEIAAELLKSKERINERAVQNGAVDSPQLLEETIDIFQVPRELII